MRVSYVIFLLAVVAAAAVTVTSPGWSAETVAVAQDVSSPVGSDRTVSGTVWYQGFLVDSGTGQPTDGSINVTAELFDQPGGGASLWGPEAHADVSVSGGWFSIELGSIDSPLPDFASPPYYLQLTINGEPMNARQKLASVPSAIRAGDVDGGGGGGIEGGGDAGYVAVFTGPTEISNSNIYETTGRYSIGTTTSDAKLRVENAGDLPVLKLVNTSTQGVVPVLHVERSGSNPEKPLLYMKSPWMAGNYHQVEYVLTSERGDSTVFWIDGWGGVNSATSLSCVTDNGAAVYGSTGSISMTSAGVYGIHTAPDFDGTGVYGSADDSDGYGRGGVFEGGYMGVDARVFSLTYGGPAYGIRASATGGDGASAYGVRGSASAGSGGVTYGIYGDAYGATTNWAGYFDGDVYTAGTLLSSEAGFRIDHPDDPSNTYLNHAFVASSEMKTVYDGVAILDANGRAVVELPGWFETLNTSARYQLTPVGAAAPNLHVSERLSGGRFGIAGGPAGLEVCWQVTGVRHDPVAREHGMAVEEAKPDAVRGSYIDPELYGAPGEAREGVPPDRNSTTSPDGR